MSDYTTDQKNRAIAIYREHGPSEASRRTGAAKSTITRWAQAAGVRTTVLSRTAAATAAASVDARALRLKIAGLTLQGAEKVLEIIYRRLDDEADTMPLKDLAIIAGVLVDKHVSLSHLDGEHPDTSAVDSWLDYVMSGETIDPHDPRLTERR
ncbi:hypothetical protein CXR25_13735 [Brevibacterium aurantiacum]|uniref:hypothetical protein n=1 Tax=Brevibacterium aurantiacum TaxID=273384 RepID=UPI000F6530DF|nr:hypothetical protein [Brevibacterium aurantiacum]AZL13758.1 hypothetical protein CXR25_13735 [Brevibacterium aurantiacum]